MVGWMDVSLRVDASEWGMCAYMVKIFEVDDAFVARVMVVVIRRQTVMTMITFL